MKQYTALRDIKKGELVGENDLEPILLVGHTVDSDGYSYRLDNYRDLFRSKDREHFNYKLRANKGWGDLIFRRDEFPQLTQVTVEYAQAIIKSRER